MKKTLTKTTALLLVFAMLLSVFAVFAGSAFAKDKVKPNPEKPLTEWVKDKAHWDAVGFVEHVKGYIAALPGQFTEKFEADVNTAVEAIKAPLDLEVDPDGAYEALEKIAFTYTNPFPAEGEEAHYLPDSVVVQKLNDVFGISFVLNRAEIALEKFEWFNESWVKDVVKRAEYDNLMAGFKAELKALVKLRDDKCHLLLNVVVAGGNITTPIVNTVSAVVSLAVAPQRVANIGVEAKLLFEDVAKLAESIKEMAQAKEVPLFSKYNKKGFEVVKGFVSLVKDIKNVSGDTFEFGTKTAGAVIGVKAAVETVKNFPATVGAIGDNVQAFGASVQTLFNYVFKLA